MGHRALKIKCKKCDFKCVFGKLHDYGGKTKTNVFHISYANKKKITFILDSLIESESCGMKLYSLMLSL